MRTIFILSVLGQCDRNAMEQKEEESEVAEWKIEQVSGKVKEVSW